MKRKNLITISTLFLLGSSMTVTASAISHKICEQTYQGAPFSQLIMNLG